MQERSATPSFGNIAGFVAVVVIALSISWLSRSFFPQPQPANAPNAAENERKVEEEKAKDKEKQAAEKKAAEKKAAPKSNAEKLAGPKPADEPKDMSQPPVLAQKPPPADDDPRGWIALGSVDPNLKSNPYRMLVTLTRRGGAVARLELASDRYRNLDDRSGYLGHLVMDATEDKGPGCLAQVVGAGTPAAAAGIRPGDRVLSVTYRGKTTKIDAEKGVDNARLLEDALRETEPEQQVELLVRRGVEKPQKGQPIKKDPPQEETLTARLIRRPLEVIRPEQRTPDIRWDRNGPRDATDPETDCPLSFLTSLQQVDDDKLKPDEKPDAKLDDVLSEELPGVELREAIWTLDSPKKDDPAGPATKAVFSCVVPKYHLKVTKTYELAKVDPAAANDQNARAYHLVLSIAITNLDKKAHKVAYRQDGPNGLPTEGSWYVTGKVSRGMAMEGLRDVVYKVAHQAVDVKTCSNLADKNRIDIGEASQFDSNQPEFFGVDAQYFSVIAVPDADSVSNIDRLIALRVGDVEPLQKTLTNTTFRLLAKPTTIEPGEDKPTLVGRYEVFAGPKRSELLAEYPVKTDNFSAAGEFNLSGIITYGWEIFRWTAVPMTAVLEFFYGLVRNYGLAIILLTVLVRLAMHPMSRRQAINALRMQTVQKKMAPEIAELTKKYKKNPEALQKARMELMQKHGMNPFAAMGGCLLLFIQMPIFLGLYRALQVDVELRGAALIPLTWVRWCSNLAAPDMLWDWSRLMPDAINNGIGFPNIWMIGRMLGLGPYLNLLPIITLILYLLQQKVMMPPPADDQAAAQQKMMKYMMIFFGLMFFKIAAGLCIYFIASTLWGLAEKQFLPKSAVAIAEGAAEEETKPIKPLKPRLTDSEREAIRRAKRKK